MARVAEKAKRRTADLRVDLSYLPGREVNGDRTDAW